jgi:hypothetical protein
MKQNNVSAAYVDHTSFQIIFGCRHITNHETTKSVYLCSCTDT